MPNEFLLIEGLDHLVLDATGDLLLASGVATVESGGRVLSRMPIFERPPLFTASAMLVLPPLVFTMRAQARPAAVTASLTLPAILPTVTANGTMTPAAIHARADLRVSAFDLYLSVTYRDRLKRH